jgi:hypothetical protein
MPVPNAFPRHVEDFLQAPLAFGHLLLGTDYVGNVMRDDEDAVVALSITERLLDGFEMADRTRGSISAVLEHDLRLAPGHDVQDVLAEKCSHLLRYAKITVVLAHHGLGGGVVELGHGPVAEQEIGLFILQHQHIGYLVDDHAQQTLTGAQRVFIQQQCPIRGGAGGEDAQARDDVLGVGQRAAADQYDQAEYLSAVVDDGFADVALGIQLDQVVVGGNSCCTWSA